MLIIPWTLKTGCPPRSHAPTTLSCEAVSTYCVSREAERNMAAQLKPLLVSGFSGQGYRNLARAQAQTVFAEFTIFIEKKLKDKPN